MNIISKHNGSVLNILIDNLLHLSVFVPNIETIYSCYDLDKGEYRIYICMRSGTVTNLLYKKRHTWELVLGLLNNSASGRHPLDPLFNEFIK